MDFNSFLNSIPKIANLDLPGIQAHLIMAPFGRQEMMKKWNVTDKQPKESAVMLLFYPKENQTHLVLIKRNDFGIHSSQIAFPGGKKETTDYNFEKTALRETYEEIGIPENKIKIIKAFSSIYVPPSNFLIYPFLGFCSETPTFIAQIQEVAAIIEMPISVLLDPETKISQKLSTSYANQIEVPAFRVQDHIVWGATAMILSELREVLLNI